jgi:katanin p60 ATPase-containing subunit A1
VEVPLTMQDFQEAIKNIQRSVAAESLKKYEEWMKEFGAV